MASKASMDGYGTKGKNLEGQMEKGAEKIEAIGKEFKGVKDELKGIPGGLDSDLLEMINNIEKSGREEALADIKDVESTVIDKAKTDSDALKNDVGTKIADNKTAKTKLESINSNYGKDAVKEAKAAIDTNTKKGEDVLKSLKDVIKSTDTTVKKVKDSL